MKISKILWLALGCAGLALGAVGAVLPMLPAFPFLLLAAFGFARSSPRLHRWFVGTRLYKHNLESYVQGRGMTRPAKRRVMATVTALMGFGFLLMLHRALYLPCGILAAVWAFHMLYFRFGVKTCAEPPAPPAAETPKEPQKESDRAA